MKNSARLIRKSSTPLRVSLGRVSIGALAAVGSVIPLARAAAAEPVRVTVLETSDVHGRVLPWDYARARAEDVGLGRIASRVAAIRQENPNVLLLDGGDTIQGTPVEYLQARRPPAGPDPMTATFLPVRVFGGSALIQPSL